MADVDGYAALMRRMTAIGQTQPLMRAAQLDTIRIAKSKVPRKTGNLGRRIQAGPVDKDSAVINVNANYAAPVEFGSKPHIIKPRNGKVLAWGGPRRLSGRLRSGASPTNFATLVHHPGNRPKPYLIPAAKEALKRAGIGKIIERWNGAA